MKCYYCHKDLVFFLSTNVIIVVSRCAKNAELKLTMMIMHVSC